MYRISHHASKSSRRVATVAAAALAIAVAGAAIGQTAHAAELAKPEPALASVAAVANGARDQGAALRKQVQGSWLSLYATFSPDQKNVIKGILQQHLARMDAMQQKMQQQHAATPGS